MKKLKNIGKLLIAFGVLQLFRTVDGFYGIGGYVDNTWKIIFISIVLVSVVFLIVFIDGKYESRNK